MNHHAHSRSYEPWATIRIWLSSEPTPREQLAEDTDRLEAMASLLAERADAGGVELRDASSFEPVERPELWIYTVPGAVDGLVAHARMIAQHLGLVPKFAHQVHEGDNWRDRWKMFYRPMVLGRGTLLIRPSWIEPRPDDPALEIVLDPGRAFGTGLHESTRLCLDALVEAFDHGELQPSRVLDVGCGSGVLALAAARLFGGDALVVAIDIDPEATETSRENAVRNDLSDRIRVVTGTIDLLPNDEPFSLVLANIRRDTLLFLVPDLVDRLAPAGLLILSGILTDEGAEVTAAYVRAGFELRRRADLGDWCALHLVRKH